jgi:shikimate kinase
LDKHLYLIGPRGAGKSQVGQQLAKELQAPFYDADVVISQEQGRSIEQIVREDGWGAFRNMESKVMAHLAEQADPAVIATGGGVVLKKANRQSMQNNGIVIYLEARAETLLERIEQTPSNHRPALTNLPPAQEIALILREREHLYKTTATAIVNAALPEKKITAAILKIITDLKNQSE